MKRVDLIDEYVRSICALGQGAACCRYLSMAADGWDCEKQTPLKKVLDQRVRYGQMTAQGDNCQGVTHEETNP